jgi:hypothetical protein
MDKKLTRKFSAQGRDVTLSLRAERFPPSDERELPSRGKHDRKYNIKVMQEDVVLLDAVAKTHDVTRSLLLNNLLHQILMDELQGIEEYDVRLLLAQTADQRAQYDDLSTPWVFDAIGSECLQIIENVMRYNRAELQFQEEPDVPADHTYNSDNFKIVKEALKGMVK